MGLYQVILAPAVFVTDGRARVWQETGALVELTEEEAASFDPPEAVRLLNTETPEAQVDPPAPSGQPVTFVDETLTTDPPTEPVEAAPGSAEAAVDRRRARAKAGGGNAVNDQD